MSEKMAKKIRRALKNIDVNVDDPKRYRHSETMQIVSSQGRRIYKAAKKKAKQMQRDGRRLPGLKAPPAPNGTAQSD